MSGMWPLSPTAGGVYCGYDDGSPCSDRYQLPFTFTGTIHSVTIDIGKKTLKWGKGYAWNPAAFVDRPKDPDEPEQNLEGFIVASMDWIRSFRGPLKTVSFTPVLVPAPGSFGAPPTVTATTASPGADLRYTNGFAVMWPQATDENERSARAGI